MPLTSWIETNRQGTPSHCNRTVDPNPIALVTPTPPLQDRMRLGMDAREAREEARRDLMKLILGAKGVQRCVNRCIILTLLQRCRCCYNADITLVGVGRAARSDQQRNRRLFGAMRAGTRCNRTVNPNPNGPNPL